MPTPALDYWRDWNREWRFGDGLDPFMARQRDVALEVATTIGRRDVRILDVGCGTGWLGQALTPFGQVWATDITEPPIIEGRRRFPNLTFIVGDFVTVALPESVDLIVTADAFLHFDHRRAVERFAALLRPGGTLLLMNVNPFVWQRRPLEPFPPGVPHGALEEWPTKAQTRAWLTKDFAIDRITTIDPGGDRGILWWVENRYVRRILGRLIGRERYRDWLEGMGVGRELVFIAHRR
jgi:SAM-dependent methyltransferase